jgi:hypothetical protein
VARESLSIDGGPPLQAEIQHPDRPDWIAGPVRLAVVDVERDGHHVEILSGTRQGWTATAGHGISAHQQLVYLNGREPFAPPEEGENEAPTRVVRETTEGK